MTIDSITTDADTGGPDAVQQRIAIVAAAIAVFTRQAYRRTTIKDIATEAGISIQDLQQHFPSWQGLVLATLDSWHRSRLEPLAAVGRDQGVLVFMRRLVEDNENEPAFPRMLLAVLADATDPVHPSSSYLQQRYQAFHELVVHGFEHDIAMGRVPVDLNPVAAAEHIVSVWEGLQIQSMLRPEMNILATFDHAIGLLARDWGLD